MRNLITLTTAALASVAVAGTVAAAAIPGAEGGGEPPCRPVPGSTVWTWPLASAPVVADAAPAVLRGFEPPEHRWDAGHRGVDLAGPAGTAVVAAGAGTVLFAGRVADEGVVVVGHGTLRTSYEPVDPEVPAGTRVATGQRIGTLDAGHCAATACLHWGLLTGRGHATVYYDPLLLLGCGEVRLEPLGPAGSD